MKRLREAHRAGIRIGDDTLCEEAANTIASLANVYAAALLWRNSDGVDEYVDQQLENALVVAIDAVLAQRKR